MRYYDQLMGEYGQAASYEVLVERWAKMSSGHMSELVQVGKGDRFGEGGVRRFGTTALRLDLGTLWA